MASERKYNVLINGRNMSMIMDFIVHSETYFKCLSSSDCWQDVLGHFELFKPDVYVCFVDSVYSKILTQTNTLKGDSLYNDAPIFVVADEETCDELEQNPRRSIDVVIRRPISTENLILRIMMHLDEREKAQQEADQAAALAEEARQAALAAREAQEKVSRPVKEKRPELWKSWDITSPKPKAAEAKPAEASVRAAEAKPAEASVRAAEAKPAEAPVRTAEAKPAEAPVRTPEANPGGRKHILIVDDDRTVLKMLKTALEEDYDITTMVNGLMVEKFLMAKKVDMIILDYEMPGETGADIFRKLKENELAKKVPVCFLTGVSEREKIMEVMAMKPHSFLLKPIDMDMLKAAIINLTR